MTRDEVVAKARDLTVPVLGRDTSTRLVETILDIEKVTEIRSLRRLLQRGWTFIGALFEHDLRVCREGKPVRPVGP